MHSSLSALFAVSVLASCQTQHQYDYSELIPPTQSFPASAFRQSIHHSDFTADPMVTNGDCYEQFEITIPESITTVLLPPGTTTYRRDGTVLVGHLEKTLSWAGHPGDTRTSIDDERAKMSVAMKITGRTLRIVSFGAWYSFEGGSGVTVLAGIAAGVAIRDAKELPEKQTADRLALEGWFVIASRPALKQDYDHLASQ